MTRAEPMAIPDELLKELKARSDADPLGFRKAAAWEAVKLSDNLRSTRQKLSLYDLRELIEAIVHAAIGAHDWFTPNFIGYECCRACGIIKRADGKNKPCKGPVGVRPRR